MKKLTLVAYGKDKQAILKTLEKTGVVEVQRSELIEKTFNKEDLDRRDEITSVLLRLQFVFDFLKSENRNAVLIKKAEKKAEKNKNPVAPDEVLNAAPKKKKFISPTPRIGFEKFYEIEGREDEILNKVARLEEISRNYADIKAEINKLNAQIEGLSVYKDVAVRMSSFCDTAHTVVTLGVINSGKTDVLEKIKGDFPVYIETTGSGGKLLPVCVVALKTDADKVFEAMNEAEFVKSSYTFDMTAGEKIDELRQNVKNLQREKQKLLEESLTFEYDLPDFKQLYDYYTVESARLVASDGLALTKSSFILEGWFPKDDEEKVVSAIKNTTDAVVLETREPIAGDSVPTLTKNNKIVAPYENITNMYSPPSYRDVDPNPVVAFFYFLIFGIMMGDAVYGLILMLGGFLGYYLMKPAPGKGKIFLIIGMGGLSTFIWGILFGGWLALDVSGTFLEKLIWFKPIDESNPNTALYMLGLSLAVGVVQINVSLAMRGYILLKRDKDVLGFLNEVASWFSILVGIVLVALNMLLKLSKAYLIAGIVFLAVGLLLIIVLGGRNKKGIKKVFGGFSQLYGGVNFFSDILSYSRLFGLGLSTAVIGMVVNEICKVIINILTINGVSVLGVIVAIPIFAIGHVFNIAINTLGTYIHDARLQFIEFFGRFYEGGGHVFKPLGSNTKYNYIEK